jgi:uncharacterized protein (UPF0333 family)
MIFILLGKMYIYYLPRGSTDKNELVIKITMATRNYNANHTRNRMSDINTSMDMIILKNMYNILHVPINGFISVFVCNVIVRTSFARKCKIVGKNGVDLFSG